MKFRCAVALLLMALAPVGAQAQTVLQGGPWTPGHAPMYSSSGLSQPVVTDSGTAGGGALGKNLSEIGIVARDPNNVYPSVNSGSGPFFTHSCVYDAPTTNPTGYHFLCLDPNAQGGGLVAYGAGGAAAPLPLYFNINGTKYQFQSVLNSTANNLLTAGCIADGVTDQTACINNVLTTSNDCVFVPPTQSGFYVAGTLSVTKCLMGSTWNPISPTTWTSGGSGGSFSGQSWIKCAAASAIACVQFPTSANSQGPSPYMANITIVGAIAPASGGPVAGSIGFQYAGGFNANTLNVAVYGFDTCMEEGPVPNPPGTNPIAMHNYNTGLFYCKSYYNTQDGEPETYFIGGRWGANSQYIADYSPTAILHFTRSTATGGGGGPNTFTMIGTHINPGGSGHLVPGCLMSWDSFASPSGISAEYRFDNMRIEVYGTYTGAGKTGVICSDSTVPYINQFWIHNSSIAFDTGNYQMFNIDPATSIQGWHFDGNSFTASQMSLTIPNGGAAPDENVNRFTNNTFNMPSGTILTGQSARFVSYGNWWGTSLDLEGTWTNATFGAERWYTTFTDNASGYISWTTPIMLSWTPVVQYQAAQFTGTISGGTTLTVSGVTGALAIGQSVYAAAVGPGAVVLPGTTITGGSGTTWTISPSQSALGPIAMSSAANSTLAWTTSGLVSRTSDGGFEGTFNFAGPGSGVEGSSGILVIGGLPYQCGSGQLSSPPRYMTGMSSVGSGVAVVPAPAGAQIWLQTPTSTGTAYLSNSNVTNAANVSASFKYNSAL